MNARKLLSAAKAVEPVYVESIFSTYLYTGNGSTQTITNGIDLAGEGGMVWIKSRSAATNHFLFDTARGTTDEINSNTTDAEASLANSLTAFNADGFSISSATGIGVNAATYASWTFRKAPKFFDVVTYTGTGANRTVAHGLGSVPGCIIVKRTDTTGDWQVYHRANTANPETDYLVLNSTAATADSNTRWNDTLPTATEFSLGTEATVNASGGTYVAYLFAHDAGGFGDSGAENVISCGSISGFNGRAGLGYEPQFVLLKETNFSGNWLIYDNMRGWVVGSNNDAALFPNLSNAESTGVSGPSFDATGFNHGQAGENWVYIAIRRGPMKTPTSGTEVYQPLINQPLSGGVWNHNILTDFSFYHWQNGTQNWGVQDRLRGAPDLSFNSTAAESALIGGNKWDVMTGYINTSPGAGAYSSWAFRRAPGFFDVVCYTGTGSATTVAHNLGVVPELMIVKKRSATDDWAVYANNDNTDFLLLNTTAATADDNTYWNDTSPTASVFTVGTNADVNTSAATYVAYLFATVPGVSKVGSYTGNGTSQTIDCGFTTGARFVLIKRTDNTGDWYVWDTARGIVAGNDPYILLNSGATSVTGTDYIDPYSAGFEISSTAPAAINASGGTFIFLAIA